MPARAIIILQRTTADDGSPVFGYVLRADVPLARRPFVANPLYKTPFVPISPDIDPDATSLTTGAVVEKPGTVKVDAGLTVTDIQAVLQRLQGQFQVETTADKTFLRYGSFFTGTAWTAQGA